MNRRALVCAVCAMLVLSPLPHVASAQSNAVSASIRSGTCQSLGAVSAQLQNPTAASGSPVGSSRAVGVASSFTPAPAGLDSLLGSDHVVTLSEGDKVVSCGAIGGVLEPTGALGIAIRPVASRGPDGVAYFSGTGDVSLFVVPHAGDESPASQEATTSTANPVATLAPADHAAPTPPAVSSSPGTRENPLPIGTAADIGGNWVASVVSVNPDAWGEVQGANMFNDPPADGMQFVMVTISATYNGAGSSRLPAGNEFSVVGPSSVSYSSFSPSCGVVPNAFPQSSEVFSGGTVQGNVCFPVKAGDVSALVMFTQDFVGFDRSKRVWFALH